MSALPISLLPVLSIIAVMERPGRAPGMCAGCWHLAPSGTCASCGIEICAHCRHEARTHVCDGCGCDIDSDERINRRNQEDEE